MASPAIHALRPGMQVHAVPESERAFDASGRKLPWGFEYADSALPETRRELEKGPFGRSQRRRGTSRSRSKTAEPQKKEDVMRHENLAFEDSVFGKVKDERKSKDERALQPVDANVRAGPSAVATVDREPTEVILYGFGDEQEWAAIHFYESVSNGTIYEDYARNDPHDRFHNSSYRVSTARSLSKAALRKKNAFAGGAHWIKVTFDSPEAADLACARSPHHIKGHLVYAEPYMGKGPAKDAPILASNAGAQITSDQLPMSFSTTAINQIQGSPSSDTISSATATGQAPSQPDFQRGNTARNMEEPFTASRQLSRSKGPSQSQIVQRPLRIQGASRAVLLPADQAFVPAQPRWTVSRLLIGPEIFGEIPRKADGSVEWEKAGYYWRFWAWVDGIFGSDWCGLKDEEEAVIEMKKLM